MKLKLRTSGDIQILTIEDLRTEENLKLLKAGITKLFKSGKNKIILELLESGAIPVEVLRELGRLKLLANELSGDIVLAGMGDESKTQIENFSKPPFTRCFGTTEQAIQYFAPAPVAAPANAPVVGTPKRGEDLKEQIKQRELGELGTLRKENERLRAENESLQRLFATKILYGREPLDAQGDQEKIRILEAQLADILGKAP